MQDGTLLAAVDLGSNSFRLEIGRYEHGHIQRVEYLKETVRQGGGLDEERNLSQAAMQRGWDCLARFAERLADFAPRQVRAVATQTLREAKNRDVFLERGNAILGRQYQAHEVASFRVGSVSWSKQFFADGQLTAAAFRQAETAAQAMLDEALAVYRPERWERAYGSSGTVGAVAEILAACGHESGVIYRQGLDWLLQQLLRAGHTSRVELSGLKDDRRPVIGGGVSVLRALFDLLQIDRLHVAQGALRQGALYDLIDRSSPGTDKRSATVAGLAQRFAVDGAQAERVARAAGTLFAQATPELPADFRRRHGPCTRPTR